MDEQLEKFLSEINLDSQYYSEFEDGIIDKVEYLEDSKYFILYLELEKILNLNTYQELIAKINDYHLDINLIITLRQLSYSADLVFDYYQYFLSIYKNKNSYLDSLKFDFKEDVLRVGFANSGLKSMFETFKLKLEGEMKIAGFDLTYDYFIDENDHLNDKIDDLIKQEEIKVDLDRIEKKASANKKNSLIQNGASNKTVYRKSVKDLSDKKVSKIIDVYDDLFDVCFEGYLFDVQLITTKNDTHIQVLKLTDFSDSIVLKRFQSNSLSLSDLEKVKAGQWVKAYGDVRFDNFSKEHVMFLKTLVVIEPKKADAKDLAKKKRVELHLHTNMSTMDGISHISEYLTWAKENEHQAIAITDRNNVQAYPDAFNNALSRDVKLIYGLESNMIDDTSKIVFNVKDVSLNDACFVFFDFETTGLKSNNDEIIEIGAVKVKNGLEIGRFQAFVKPKQIVPLFIKELTGISDFDLRDAKSIQEVLPEFIDFYQDCILVAHNASFDVGFLNKALEDLNYPSLNNCVIDTLQLSRALNKNARSHRLGTVAKNYKVSYDTQVAHRADYDALVLSNVFNNMIQDLKNNHDINNIKDINNIANLDFLLRQRPYHCSILVKNQVGLKDLFKLVSKACTEYFYGEPNLLKSMIAANRENLLIGSGSINGEVYKKAGSLKQEELIEVMKFYDYIEVYPVEIQTHLVDLGDYTDLEEIKELTKYIIETALKAQVPVVAAGDVHYLRPSQKEFREVYINAKGVNGKMHPLYDRKKRIKNIPDQHFRTTQEMLECFDFLDKDLAYEIVVENTNKIADMIEEVKPIKDKLYTPSIEGVDEKLSAICYENARAKYGKELPEIVELRLKKELDSIIKHGFAVVYYISSLLVEKSLADGFLVGSRGSVGSSLVATLSNITEVNPLVPHYYCPNCQYSEFFEDGSYGSGYDLPNKDCPHCGHALKGDGQDIPFETFLGFEGNKVPDIDLNFSSVYQYKAHNFTKEIFGEDHVFRAGTITTVQNKTAYGYAKGYHEEKFFGNNVRSTELERLAQGSEGVKRTTGQHPGGIIVIPENMDVFDFTPINYPADDLSAPWKTTHFDFHAIHDNVLKLDILGHVDPTALRYLSDLTGVDVKTIPTNDPKVLSLFSSTDALELSNPYAFKNGALGIPEFGTSFVRSMLEETNPKSFAELIQISGLSHGTDVWVNNAQTLIKSNICRLEDVIGCRDDIMVYLMYKGLDPKLAFNIMESVRKGKGLNEEWIAEMKKHQVPEWYIDSCQKIKYMFPKAHAVAYVLMALRIAWFKVYYPLEYYAVYFSTRCEVFDLEVMIKGVDAINAKIKEINDKGYEATAREKSLIDVFELSLELYYRGFQIKPIDINKSDATKFIVDYDNKAIIPSFIALDSLGTSVADSIINARDDKEFISIEDFETRTQVGKKHLDFLNKIGSLNNFQEKNQLSLF